MSNLAQNKDLRDLLSGSAVAIIVKVAGVGLSYVFLAILTTRFGASSTGVFSLAQSTLIVLTIVGTMGFPNAILRYASQLGGQQNRHHLHRVLTSMAGASLTVSFILGAAVYLLSDRLSLILLKNGDSAVVFRLIAVALPFSSLSAIIIEGMRGLQKIRMSELIRTVNTNVWNLCVFIILVLLFPFNRALPVLSYATAVVATAVVAAMYWRREIPSGDAIGTLRSPNASPGVAALLTLSLPMLVTVILQFVVESAGIIILGATKGPHDAGIYSIALKLSTLTSFLLVAVNTIAGPKFAELYWSNRLDELRMIVRSTSRLIFWSCAPILLLLVLLPEFFLGLFGADAVAAKYALLILCAGQFINVTCGSVGIFLLMTGGQREFGIFLSVAALLSVVLGIALAVPYGFLGVSVATALSLICWNILSLVHINRRYAVDTFYLPFVTLRS